jgi:hypothetical protein
MELDSCPDDDRAIELWQRAADSDTPTVAAQAWLSLGCIQQYSASIAAAHAVEQTTLAGDTSIGGRATLSSRAGDASAQPARAAIWQCNEEHRRPHGHWPPRCGMAGMTRRSVSCW